MASLREMRKRVASVKSIRQITKAMKMVAAARLRRAQEAILAARPYARRIEEVLSDIAARHDVSQTALLRPSNGRKTVLVVITADKGLCGSFNTNILRCASRYIREKEPRNLEIIAVGRKGRDFFRRRGYTIRKEMIDVFRHLSFETALQLRDEIVEPYLAGEVGHVQLIYNEFKSAMAQQVVSRAYLPVPGVAGEKRKSEIDFEYEPSAQAVFEALLPQYFAVELWTAFLESHSAEMGARMTAMESATKNAEDMIARLTLESNRIRQAGITQEIAEIVGGAEALQ
ncbi:MAG: ATP synthase F1 subunit gamma [Candidatus Hydrogenedentota bacterium]|nr:MAG: ATP synthase F1 subunit gamma [Candidatus Hydrogenedentota bacterium]